MAYDAVIKAMKDKRIETRHEHGKPCPFTGKIVDGTIFSDRKRWDEYGHPYNACRHCHDDQRSIGDRLHDLNEKLKNEQ